MNGYRILPTVVYATLLAVLSSIGLPAFAQSAGPDALTESYEDWTVRCGRDPSTEEDARRVCFMQQQLSTQRAEGRQRPVLTVFIAQTDDDGAAQLTAVTPFNVDLEQGMDIVIDDLIVEANFLTCRRQGCLVRRPLGADIIEKLRAGEEAIFSIAFVGGRTIDAPVSLRGFSAAWNRLNAL